MSLSFGTSGIRGLVTAFTENECYFYAKAFLALLRQRGIKPRAVLMARDLRESSPLIQNYLARSLASFQIKVLEGACVPTPALALGCSELNLPGIMITGSHIPADRNGFKFYLPEGEILKEDEKMIATEYEKAKSEDVFFQDALVEKVDLEAPYLKRYVSYFGKTALKGMRLGFYEHSGVGRDLVVKILRELGAEVRPFGRSEAFIPVDTEAVQATEFLAEFLFKNKLHSVLSTDGDADRPLVMSDAGKVIPGEILGLITSRVLEMHTAVFPISCSTVLEKSGWIPQSERTQIGSPFVLGKIAALKKENADLRVAGFEANGGYLLSTSVGNLQALNTRDSVLPMVAVLNLANQKYAQKISALMEELPQRVNQSGLIKNFERVRAQKVLKWVKNLITTPVPFEGLGLGQVVEVNEQDGLRMTFQEGSIVHLRPSGNAPEFRIYIESDSERKAQAALNYFTAVIMKVEE